MRVFKRIILLEGFRTWAWGVIVPFESILLDAGQKHDTWVDQAH